MVSQHILMARALQGLRGAVEAQASPSELRFAAIQTADEALTSLGYSTIVVEGSSSAAIQATRGHEIRIIGIDSSLTVFRDGAGLVGDSCHGADDAIVEEMARRGLELGKPKKARDHGSSGGGDLLRKLAKDHASSNLAEAFVKAHDGDAHCGVKGGVKQLHKSGVRSARSMKEVI